MAYWLLKSEPDTFSWDNQLARGAKGEPWSGVRNHQAKLNLMRMKKGERGFFYHSVAEKSVVGIVEVIREHYPDPTAEPGTPWVVVDVVARSPMHTPVSLSRVRQTPALAGMMLVRHSRLSVQPVSDAEWHIVCALGGITA